MMNAFLVRVILCGSTLNTTSNTIYKDMVYVQPKTSVVYFYWFTTQISLQISLKAQGALQQYVNIHDTNHTKATRPPTGDATVVFRGCQSTTRPPKKLCSRLQSLSLSLSHSLHFSLPHILRLAQARLLGSCSSLPSQRQLALYHISSIM